jgi:hypothetical protein
VSNPVIPESKLVTFFKYGLPWVFYFAAGWSDHLAMGSVAAFLLLLLLCLRAPQHLKAVEIVLGGFFFMMWLGTTWFPLSWLTSAESYLASALLTLMAFGSLFIGSPFTLAYAREYSPAEMWHNPHFYLVNRILTALWGVGFLLCTALKYWHGFSTAVTYALCFSIMFLVALFTQWFPPWYRQEFFLKDPRFNKSEIAA